MATNKIGLVGIWDAVAFVIDRVDPSSTRTR
jgi:predicted ATP-dependent Lon-type protease